MGNDKFQMYMQNFNRRLRFPGAASAAKIDQSSYQFTEFYRDSRHAFGVRFQVEKKNRDYLYTAAAVLLFVAVLWIRFS